MTHFEHLLFYVPDLAKRRILDIGAGRGKFLIEGAERGIKISGIEYNPENVLKAKRTAGEKGLVIDIAQGEAEHLQFPNDSFDFLNFAEVIEHVRSPEELLDEAYRVLSPSGFAYVSVPSRFCWFDPHFKIAFVNWVPRAWSDTFIRIFGEHKDYSGQSGFQRLSELHYYTYSQFVKFAKKHGFKAKDMRIFKIEKKFPNPAFSLAAKLIYKLARPWYFRAFHFLLEKNGIKN